MERRRPRRPDRPRSRHQDRGGRPRACPPGRAGGAAGATCGDLRDRRLGLGTTRFDTKLGQPREVGNVLRAIRRTLADARPTWAGSHTFRRTVATWMDADGAPLAEIANQLGHVDVNTTGGYLDRRQARRGPPA
ncbi:tyrosine-type recombinase/integrase [Nocardioides dongkuii]|uniref:tyrosine-type recombinase/integrase n=1 Tax=Nocardioides dongkuii TaxID=2760089 RepID=UPI0015FB95F5|nr:tyrosine-type recombinase/integrase [Nocardioides dongkuii]